MIELGTKIICLNCKCTFKYGVNGQGYEDVHDRVYCTPYCYSTYNDDWRSSLPIFQSILVEEDNNETEQTRIP